MYMCKYYLVMEDKSFLKETFLCTVASVQETNPSTNIVMNVVKGSGQVYMMICMNPPCLGGSLAVNSASLDLCSSHSDSLASST